MSQCIIYSGMWYVQSFIWETSGWNAEATRHIQYQSEICCVCLATVSESLYTAPSECTAATLNDPTMYVNINHSAQTLHTILLATLQTERQRNTERSIITPALVAQTPCTPDWNGPLEEPGSIPRLAGRSRVRISGVHALTLICRTGKEGLTVSSIICDRWITLS